MKTFLFIILITPLILCAQINPKTKWGNVSQAEIDYKEVSFEKDAGAVILFENGVTSVYEGKNYNRRISDRGRLLLSDNIVEKKVYRRIKILNESELSQMKQQIKYISFQGTEHIQNLKAQTINSENGQINIYKVEKDAIKDLKINEENNIMEIHFPNVKVGSIIELEYTLYDKRVYYVEAWKFQHNIPTLFSELKFNYDTQSVYKGITQGEQITELINSKDKYKPSNEWYLRNIPSNKTINHIYNPENGSEQIAFQLLQYSSYLFNLNFEKTTYIEGVDSWEKIGKSQMSDFKNFSKSSNSKNINKSTDLIGLKNLVDAFNKTHHWNNLYSYKMSQSLQQLNQNKTGNSTELNVLLNSILTENGYDAQLVLISTRNNGKLIIQNPNLKQFNSTINLVTLKDNSIYLLDAANLNIDFGYMPLENFNQYGFLLDKKESKFINLEPPLSEFNSTQNYAFKDGRLYLTRTDKFNGYFKADYNGFENNVTNSLSKAFPTIQRNIIQLDDRYAGTKTVSTVDKIEHSYSIQNPLKDILANYLFPQNNRNQQLEFNFPYYYNITTIIKIPDGYTIEIPNNFNYQTEFDSKKLYYAQSAEIKDGNLILSTALYLSKSIYTSFYINIKRFFEDSNNASQKTILLKKI